MSWDTAGDGWGSTRTPAQEFNQPSEFGHGAEGFSTFGGYGNEFGGGDNANGFDGGEARGGGACFNCGQEGHLKADCPNPAVAREFTGTCRICEQPGHRASDCPSAPAQVCLNCKEEGHAIVGCKNPRKIDRSATIDVPAEDAWTELIAAVGDRDMEDVKDAIDKYVKACPDITYSQLEVAFRAQDIGVFLIALEKELAKTYTNMDLQGVLNKTYTITFRFSPKPQRPKEAEGWPESAEQNAQRLEDAGVPVDCLMPLCSNCNELGHVKKNCTQDANEITDRAEVKCYNCDGVGHRVRDCPVERPDKFACRNCKKSGHSSKECPEPRSAEGVECKKCNEIGHFSKDCPTVPQIPCFNCGQTGHRKNECTNEKVLICRNCDGIGHISRDCKEKKDWSRVKCSNCQEMGHTKVKCPKPTIENNDGDDGNARGFGSHAGGGDNGFPSEETAAVGGDENWGSGGGGGGSGGW